MLTRMLIRQPAWCIPPALEPEPACAARSRTWWWNRGLSAAAAVGIAVLGWQRRWMSDDGLIYTRTVRQILAGRGPVANPGERAEACTSALWEWLLAFVSMVTRVDPARVAVYLGLVLTAAGLLLALDAGRRLHERPGRLLLPAGVLVLLALPPVWDFATSGLETGLTACWTGGAWWLLVACRARVRGPRTAAWAAFVAGLGPLVRPDLAIASIGLLAGLWLLVRPERGRLVRLAVVAGALPAGYEVFRAGFYGQLVPLPAVSKGAASGRLGRGLGYLADFVGPYWLWIALLLLGAAALLPATRRGLRRPAREQLVLCGVPAACGLLMAGYVLYIGGDFMHARMLLPALWMLLLPAMLLPAGRVVAVVPVAGLAVWSLVCGIGLRVPYQGIGPAGISNERQFYVDQAGVHDPVTAAQHAAGDPITARIRDGLASGRRVLVLPDGTAVPLAAWIPAGFAFAWPAQGIDGVDVPLDDLSIDPMGLVYPLAAHLEVNTVGRAGHDKWLSDVWIVADYGDPMAPVPAGIDAGQLAAARRALSCGALAELQASARAPMTWGRFWSNLTGSLGRTGLSLPADPYAAERQFCG